MARRPRLFAPGLLYHVIARGNHRQPTFLGADDYQAYLNRLVRYQQQHGAILYAYCLMPNHVHLLIQTSEVPLAKVMQGIQQSYTQRFNRVYRKVGHLFQGRYKAIVCDRDAYLTVLVRYIHLNPVRAGLVELPEQYPYSGHRAYLRSESSPLLDPGPVLGRFGGPEQYRRFVLAGLADNRPPDDPLIEGPDIPGDHRFSGQVSDLSGIQTKAIPRKPLGLAIDELARQVGIAPEILRGVDRAWQISRARAVVLYVLVRRLGYRPSEVASAFGRDIATVSTLISRLSTSAESSATITALTGDCPSDKPSV